MKKASHRGVCGRPSKSRQDEEGIHEVGPPPMGVGTWSGSGKHLHSQVLQHGVLEQSRGEIEFPLAELGQFNHQNN